jgi:hypothetical protein
MANTYTLIASSTVGSGGAADIEFTSIPATYTDLYVSFSLRTNLSGAPNYYDDMALRVNGDTGNNYSRLTLRNRLGTVGSTNAQTTSFMDIFTANANDNTSNTFASGYFYIPNYASSNYKSLSSDGVSETNSGVNDVVTGFSAGLWKSTSAITSLKIYSQNGTGFIQYSTAYLYGISKT